MTQSVFNETITYDTARDTVSSAKLDPGASQEGRPPATGDRAVRAARGAERRRGKRLRGADILMT